MIPGSSPGMTGDVRVILKASWYHLRLSAFVSFSSMVKFLTRANLRRLAKLKNLPRIRKGCTRIHADVFWPSSDAGKQQTDCD